MSARPQLEYALGGHDATTHDGLVRYLGTPGGSSVLARVNASREAVRDNGGTAHTRDTLATLLLDAMARLNTEHNDRRSVRECAGEPVAIPRVLSVSQRRAVAYLLQKIGFRVDEAAAAFKEEEEEEPALPPSPLPPAAKPLYKKVAAAEAAEAAAAKAKAAAAKAKEAAAELEEAVAAAFATARAAAAAASEAAAAAKAAAAEAEEGERASG